MSEVSVRHLPGTGQEAGYAVSRFNALRHGILSAHTVLPWEDGDEYRGLLAEFLAEHQPSGPTEGHLVEELAGIVWRKRRLRMAEGATYHRGLKAALAPYREGVAAALAHLGAGEPLERPVDAVAATPEDTETELRDLDEDEKKTRRALSLLQASRAGAYDPALAALREDTRAWWEEALTGESGDLDTEEEEAGEAYQADVGGLRRFLQEEVLPWYAQRRREIENRPLIRNQAFGEALDPDRLDRLARYEAHLDRKLERTLAMLLKLQELRGQRGVSRAESVSQN